MGTIVKRTDSTGSTSWQVRIRRKGYPALSQTFTTKADAKSWMTSTEASLDQGIVTFERSSTTLKDLLDKCREEVSPLKKGADSEVIRLKALCRLGAVVPWK